MTRLSMFFHNFFIHPLVGLLNLFGFTDVADWVHGSPMNPTKPASTSISVDDEEWTLRWAESAFSLPADYFDRRPPSGGFSTYVAETAYGVNQTPASQSPLHRIMCGGHPEYEDGYRSRLWGDERYRRAVAHVFTHITPEAAKAAADSVNGNGYWQPMVNTIYEALNEGLVGLKPMLKGDRLVYWEGWGQKEPITQLPS